MKSLLFASVAVVACSLGTMPSANAVKLVRTASASAANACIPAFPAYEGVIRKRPLAVQNEFDQIGYVTCAFESPKQLQAVSMTLRNQTTTEAKVSCTGVSGPADSPNVYLVKDTVVPAMGYVYLDWNAEEFGSPPDGVMPGGYFGTSCLLLPGTGIGRTSVIYAEEVGS
ncbi:MAG: hypothetical protein ABJA62_00815 [Luteimonas sp.]